jgi:branched-chain amino acid transport system ATP-binding protein
MFRVENLSKSFDGFTAVENANIEVSQNEIVAVIGPNGAGKTTLFNLITGVVKPDSGYIYYKDEEITGLPPYEILRRGIGRSFQIVNIFSRLTVFENVQIALFSLKKKSYSLFSSAKDLFVKETDEILEAIGLMEKRSYLCRTLSHGESKILEIAIALGCSPEFLILDEPTAGMAPEESMRCIELIKSLKTKRGLTILFCEHNMETVFDVAEKIAVMLRGNTIALGTPEEIQNNQRVQEVYLGKCEDLGG